MGFWDEDNEGEKQYENKAGLPAGRHFVKLGFVKLDNTKPDAKLSIKWENKVGEAWQNFTFNEKSKKFLSWQMRILGVNDYIRIQMTKTNTPVDLQQASILAFNYLDKTDKTFEIECTERIWEGKTSMNVIVIDEVSINLDDKSEAKDDTFEF